MLGDCKHRLVHRAFSFKDGNSGREARGPRNGEVKMKTPLTILLAVVLTVVSILAIMNNGCKSGRHSWCAAKSAVQSDIKREPLAVQSCV